MKVYSGPGAAYPDGRVPNVAYPRSVPNQAYPQGRFENGAYSSGTIPNLAYPAHWIRDPAAANEEVISTGILLDESGERLLDEAGASLLEE